MNRKIYYLFILISITLAGVFGFGARTVHAEDAQPVSVGKTNYDSLTTCVYRNGNRIVYYSVDSRKTWNELEGIENTDEHGAYIEMDISWASLTADVKVYIKGDINKTEESFTLPKQSGTLKVKFEKATGDFNITTDSGASYFYWRKTTDYNWNQVSMSKESETYKAFLKTVEGFRFKGAKLVFKTGQKEGTGSSDMGERPGKEVNVSVTKVGAAPSMKLNVVKLTLNTKTTMEYTNDINGTWKNCQKAMALETLAPAVFYADGNDGTDVRLFVRTAQTDKKPASLIGSITIPGQTGPPDAGEKGKDVSFGFDSDGKKFEIRFLTASNTKMFEYCVITPGKTFELSTAKWKTVKTPKTVMFSEKAAPSDSVVYVRLKGTKDNLKKNIALKLPSAYVTYTVKWPDPDAATATPTPTAAPTATPTPTAAPTGAPNSPANPDISAETTEPDTTAAIPDTTT